MKVFESINLVLLLAGCVALSSCAGDLAPDLRIQHPKITEAKISTDLNGRQVKFEDSPFAYLSLDGFPTRQITIVQSGYSGDATTIVIDMKARTGPKAIFQRKLAGKLRLHYQWIAGWTLVQIENLDFRQQQ